MGGPFGGFFLISFYSPFGLGKPPFFTYLLGGNYSPAGHGAAGT